MTSSSIFLVTLVAACFVSATLGDIAAGPQNIAAYANSSISLICQSTLFGTERIYFNEYTTGSIRQISDGDTILSGHPNSNRYGVTANTATGLYTLTVSDLVAADAGLYECIDVNQSPAPAVAKRNQVIVLGGAVNYTTTLPTTGIVTLGFYYTAECRVSYSGVAAPYFLWTGPTPFLQAYTNSTQQSWAGMSFTAEKVHDTGIFTCRMNFTADQFVTNDPNVASNVPTLAANRDTGTVFVQWAPFNISYAPVQASYEIGQVLTCYADGLPTVRYTWTDVIAGTIYQSQTLTILPTMVGQLALRCQAVNTIGSADLFQNITVNPITTTTTPGPTTPTTTVPAVSSCDPLNGEWAATRGDGSVISLCLHYDSSTALMQGLIQNNTNLDSYWNYGVGVVNDPTYSDFGITTLYAQGGVGAFAGECRKCYGVEHMLVSGVSRNSLDAFFCNIGSDLIQSPSLTFSRQPSSAVCPTSTTTWKQAKLDAERRRRRRK